MEIDGKTKELCFGTYGHFEFEDVEIYDISYTFKEQYNSYRFEDMVKISDLLTDDSYDSVYQYNLPKVFQSYSFSFHDEEFLKVVKIDNTLAISLPPVQICFTFSFIETQISIESLPISFSFSDISRNSSHIEDNNIYLPKNIESFTLMLGNENTILLGNDLPLLPRYNDNVIDVTRISSNRGSYTVKDMKEIAVLLSGNSISGLKKDMVEKLFLMLENFNSDKRWI